jgi:hypothetical protein
MLRGIEIKSSSQVVLFWAAGLDLQVDVEEEEVLNDMPIEVNVDVKVEYFVLIVGFNEEQYPEIEAQVEPEGQPVHDGKLCL